MENKLQLHFVDEAGKDTALTLSNIKDSLTAENVKQSMGAALALNVLKGKNGVLKELKKAYKITINKEELAI